MAKWHPGDMPAVSDLHYAGQLDSKTQRRKAKDDLRRGEEPQPTYTEGKAWHD